MKEDTKKWIEFAEMDLKVSKLTYQNGIYTYSAYHAQQAAEKYLKAYLIEKEEFNPKKHRTHDIRELIKACANIDDSFTHLLEAGADKLTIYATSARYPEYEFQVTRKMAKEAIQLAEKVRNHVLEKLGSPQVHN